MRAIQTVLDSVVEGGATYEHSIMVILVQKGLHNLG